MQITQGFKHIDSSLDGYFETAYYKFKENAVSVIFQKCVPDFKQSEQCYNSGVKCLVDDKSSPGKINITIKDLSGKDVKSVQRDELPALLDVIAAKISINKLAVIAFMDHRHNTYHMGIKREHFQRKYNTLINKPQKSLTTLLQGLKKEKPSLPLFKIIKNLEAGSYTSDKNPRALLKSHLLEAGCHQLASDLGKHKIIALMSKREYAYHQLCGH